MELLDFINSHYDTWEQELTSAPYNLEVRHDGDYFLLKYNMIESDMADAMTQEARGCIFFDNGKGVDLVCYPFNKFFNAEEPYAAAIDWKTASVQEKVDGSLIKFWYHNHEWHISTNGTIDADDAPAYVTAKGTVMSFEDVIIMNMLFPFYNMGILDTNKTYMFELVSPYTQIVIQYNEPELYFLGTRDMTTYQESSECPQEFLDYGIKVPKRFPLTNYKECAAAAQDLKLDQEGYVVCDANFNRIKIKSPDYVSAHHFVANVNPTPKVLIEMLRDGTLDDFMGIKPIFKDDILNFKDTYLSLLLQMDVSWKILSENDELMNDRRKFAAAAKEYTWSDFLFKKLSDNNLKAEEYLNNRPINYVLRLYEEA